MDKKHPIKRLSLDDYLLWLEARWLEFETKLYTLENYLAMGRAAWHENNSPPCYDCDAPGKWEHTCVQSCPHQKEVK